MDFLYAVGIGASFAIGIFAGAAICVAVSRTDRKKNDEAHLALNNRVEDRLEKYVSSNQDIACTLGLILDQYKNK